MLDHYVWKLILKTLSNPDDYMKRLQSKSNEIKLELQSAADHIKRQLEQELAGYERQLCEQADKEISANRIAEVSQAVRSFIGSAADELTLEGKRHIVETLVAASIIYS
ncbi:hypothetical protein D3C74_201980 [compost metagenome]